ncbi:hypothetical protein JHK85_013887 [Glycine max]|nr:hypothetical protein JHK85_013887 [Glycine max]
MASSIQQVEGDESVVLRVTHSNLKTFASDIRFSLHLTVEAVKDKLWKKCGTSVNSMHLQLYDDARNKIADLSDHSKPLAFYSPLDGFRLHVVDLDPSSVTSGGWLEDTSLVEKYTISEEAYNKRPGIKYKEKFTSQNTATAEAKIPDDCMGDLSADIKFDASALANLSISAMKSSLLRRKRGGVEGLERKKKGLEEEPHDHVKIDVGSRCEVEPGAKRGVVKFVGRAESLGPGFWVGVQYDEPLGKHDGMVKGVRYFECPPSHGGMVRPEKVKAVDLSKGLIVAFELFVLSLEKKSLCNVININWKLITMVKRELTGCSYRGCNVKKQIQRHSKDEEIVVTTYEGMHIHPVQKSTESFEHILRNDHIYSLTL